MPTTEDLLASLRDAIRQELIDELKTWWAAEGAAYIAEGDTEGAIDDAVITLERA